MLMDTCEFKGENCIAPEIAVSFEYRPAPGTTIALALPDTVLTLTCEELCLYQQRFRPDVPWQAEYGPEDLPAAAEFTIMGPSGAQVSESLDLAWTGDEWACLRADVHVAGQPPE